jgi:hypothetical protein
MVQFIEPMRHGEPFEPLPWLGWAKSGCADHLSRGALWTWFVLALHARRTDRDYPAFPLLQKTIGVGRIRARRFIGELAGKGLIRAEICAGSRKRRYVFLWHPLYERPQSVPKKAPGQVRESGADTMARLRRSIGA